MPDAMKSVLLLLLLAVCGVHPAPYEKPGVCRRRVFIALACLPAETINTCNNDFQCPGTQKCCRTGACVTSCEEPDGPKPGTCPLPSAVEPGYPNCDVDSDCGDDDRKCCRNVDGNTRCSSPKAPEKPGVCRRRFFIALVCSPDEIINTCNDDDSQCPGTQKCCRTQRCVTSCEEPDGPKPGVCPPPFAVEPGNPNCDVDSDCGNDDRKCCKNVDGNTRCSSPEKPGVCRRRFFIALVCSPAEIINTCNDDDSQCPGTQKCCRTQRCVTSCEEPDRPKPGVCPLPSALELGNPNCDVDSDCGDDDNKCCKNVEGNSRCSPPKAPEKPGVCRRRFFIALVCSPDEVINTCNDDDSQCPGTQKCCRTQRCVTSCEEPDRPKPGVCPLPSVLELGNPNCDVDSDCGDNDNKCCKNVEGNSRCSPPKAPEKPGVCRRRAFIALVCSPDEVINTCNDDDSQCPGTQKCCRTQRCVTSCEEPDAPKPGTCPPPSAVERGFPNCDVDSDCGDDDRKCCRNVDGNTRCSSPKAPEKPGTCRRRFFIAVECPALGIANTCNDDSQCPGEQKCCRTAPCSFSCEEPDGPKPGTCPVASAVEPGRPNCDVDSDCGNGDRKCCRNLEGNARCSSPRSPDRCPDTTGLFTACQFIPGVSCLRQDECTDGKLCCPYGCGSRCVNPVLEASSTVPY